MFNMMLILSLLCTLSFSQEPITPIPLHVNDVNPIKVRLGKKLFFDPILSKDGTIACVNCHILTEGGDDNLKFSFGIDGKEGNINSPTVLNARYNFVQFWDGRAKNLQEQAEGPITNPVEMGNNFKNLLSVLNKTSYKEEFEKIYKDGITKKNITDAIAEFEKTLITPNAPFDRYLKGDKNAISQKAKTGYEIFKSKGCIACHHGINLGSNMYAKFGLLKDIKGKNLGRYEITKKESEKYLFKVPTLRNIALTAPYMHDGRYDTLEDAVKFMSYHQLGKIISDKEIDSIVAFLKTLTGEILKYENK